MFRYQDDNLEASWGSKIRATPYRKTFDFPGEYINNMHRGMALEPDAVDLPIIRREIFGKLLQADMLKLYEIAYFSKGDVADIGTNRGLSSAILATAIRDGKGQGRVHTVDLSEKLSREAQVSHLRTGVTNVEYAASDAADWLDLAIRAKKRFAFVFIDHSHAYDAVSEVCRRLPDVLVEGGFAAFHDFLDPRFAVYPAVRDTFSKSFQFYGLCGCMGVYRFGED